MGALNGTPKIRKKVRLKDERDPQGADMEKLSLEDIKDYSKNQERFQILASRTYWEHHEIRLLLSHFSKLVSPSSKTKIPEDEICFKELSKKDFAPFLRKFTSSFLVDGFWEGPYAIEFQNTAFKVWDSNRNGKIDFVEFVVTLSVLLKGRKDRGRYLAKLLSLGKDQVDINILNSCIVKEAILEPLQVNNGEGQQITMSKKSFAVWAEKSLDTRLLYHALIPTQEEQRRLIKEEMDQAYVEEGTEWFILPIRWWRQWCAYTKYEDVVGSKPEEEVSPVRPFSISNQDILVTNSDHLEVKRELKPKDLKVVPEKVWEMLYLWYGGGPEIKREVVSVGASKLKRVDIWPLFFEIGQGDSTGEPKGPTQTFCRSEYTPIIDIAKWVAESLEIKSLEDIRLYLSNDKEFRLLWEANEDPKKDDQKVVEADMKGDVEDLKTEEAQEDDIPDTLGDLGVESGSLIIIDFKKAGEWTVKVKKVDPNWDNFKKGSRVDARDRYGLWYVGTVVAMKSVKNAEYLLIKYDEWVEKWNEEINVKMTCKCYPRICENKAHRIAPPDSQSQIKSGRMAERARRRQAGRGEVRGEPALTGCVGLQNLGNTCFMNSIIQCVAASPVIVPYFVKDKYKRHVNKKNPLGSGGKLSSAMSSLMKDIWSGSYRIIAPRQLKKCIAYFAPQFSGWGQQDSQEFLGYLLDGLHEDLNRVADKPQTETIEAKGRPDEEVAQESWQTYLLRNRSIIVDLFMGQLKSTVVCPDCDRISVIFEPFRYLPVPFPQHRNREVRIDIFKGPGRPQRARFSVPRGSTFQDLMNEIEAKTEIPASRQIIAGIHSYTLQLSKIFYPGGLVEQVDTVTRLGVYAQPDWDKEVVSPDDEELFSFEYSPQPPPIEEGDKTPPPAYDEEIDSQKPEEVTVKNDKVIPEEAVQKEVNIQEGTATTQQTDERDAITPKVDESKETTTPKVRPSDGDQENVQSDAEKKQERREEEPEEQAVDDEGNPEDIDFQLFNAHRDWRREKNRFIGLPLYIRYHVNVTTWQLRSYIRKVLKSWTPRTFAQDPDPYAIYIVDGRTGQSLPNYPDWRLPQENVKMGNVLKDIPIIDGRRLHGIAIIWEDNTKELREDLTRITNTTIGRDVQSRNVSVYDCVNAYLELETLEKGEEWYCNVCKEHKRAKKKLDLWNLPEILIIHLKRFRNFGSWEKITKAVDFPLKGLDLSGCTLKGREVPIYDLYAFSNHYGGRGGGHYTGCALNNDKWFNFDDSHVSQLSAARIRQQYASSAYVLFYKKRH